MAQIVGEYRVCLVLRLSGGGVGVIVLVCVMLLSARVCSCLHLVCTLSALCLHSVCCQ